jgi:hypothetical protein
MPNPYAAQARLPLPVCRVEPRTSTGTDPLQVSRIILGCMSYGVRRPADNWTWVLEEEEALKHLKVRLRPMLQLFSACIRIGETDHSVCIRQRYQRECHLYSEDRAPHGRPELSTDVRHGRYLLARRVRTHPRQIPQDLFDPARERRDSHQDVLCFWPGRDLWPSGVCEQLEAVAKGKSSHPYSLNTGQRHGKLML